jgi:hypothetical protein
MLATNTHCDKENCGAPDLPLPTCTATHQLPQKEPPEGMMDAAPTAEKEKGKILLLASYGDKTF